MGGEGWDFVIINEDGLLVRRDTGEVVGRVVEGTLDRPVRSVSGDSSGLNRRGVLVVGVRPVDGRDRGFEDFVARVEGVLLKHGVRFHRSQVEELAFKLRAIGVRSVDKVLDCVLDAGCNMFNPGLRTRVERAFEEVFGSGSLLRVQIAGELRRGGFDGLLGVDEVYAVYRELSRLLQELREDGLFRGGVYVVTLIRAAIVDLVLRGFGPGEVVDAERYIRDVVHWERALELLRRLRGLQYYLRRSMQASNSTS